MPPEAMLDRSAQLRSKGKVIGVPETQPVVPVGLRLKVVGIVHNHGRVGRALDVERYDFAIDEARRDHQIAHVFELRQRARLAQDSESPIQPTAGLSLGLAAWGRMWYFVSVGAVARVLHRPDG